MLTAAERGSCAVGNSPEEEKGVKTAGKPMAMAVMVYSLRESDGLDRAMSYSWDDIAEGIERGTVRKKERSIPAEGTYCTWSCPGRMGTAISATNSLTTCSGVTFRSRLSGLRMMRWQRTEVTTRLTSSGIT